MGILDFWKAKPVNDRELLPTPNYVSYNNSIFGRGSGDLVSLLNKKLPSSNRAWADQAGDLSLNSIVAVCVRWYVVNYNQSSLFVYRDVNGQKEKIDNPVTELIKDPMNGELNPSFIWGNFIQDYLLLGNAYLRKIRGVGNAVIALEYLPADCIRPVSDNKITAEYYIYRANAQEYKIKKEDLIHWRYLRETDNILLGRSPITSVLREIATDNVASSASFGLLKNGAMPSFILGPDSNDVSVDLSPDDLRTIKEKLRQDFSGDQAGGIAIMSGPYKFDKVSLSPAELDLSEIRRLPEERIPAALGLNAMVLGLGAGLQHSSYSNYQQSQSAAWEDGMLPLLDSLCEVLNNSLLMEFSPKPGDYIDYDVSGVKALSEDVYANSDRAALLFEKGIITRADAKRMINIEPEAEDEGFYYGSVSPTPGLAKSIANEILNAPINDYSSLKFYPTESMKEAAKRALQWKAEGKDGGTRVGLTRANQIVNGEKLSEETILRMYSFFSRHEIDKQAPGFNSGEEGFPSNGRVAWDLWGGDAGFTWASKIRNKLMEEGKSVSLQYNPMDSDYGYE